jgi:hypothetical protein
MIMGPVFRRRYQYSMRSLLVVTAMLALLLVPVVWVSRERQQMLRAREEALRAVILAERYRSELKDHMAAVPAELRPAQGSGDAARKPSAPPDASALIERLLRENAELKDTVELLRREVGLLKAATQH